MSLIIFPSVAISTYPCLFQLNEEIYNSLGVDHRKTAVYHPQCNGQDENTNKNLKRFIDKCLIIK